MRRSGRLPVRCLTPARPCSWPPLLQRWRLRGYVTSDIQHMASNRLWEVLDVAGPGAHVVDMLQLKSGTGSSGVLPVTVLVHMA